MYLFVSTIADEDEDEDEEEEEQVVIIEAGKAFCFIVFLLTTMLNGLIGAIFLLLPSYSH
jgi:hypothetical protein